MTKTFLAAPAFTASMAARRALAPPRREWPKSAVKTSRLRSSAVAMVLADCLS